MFSVCYIEGVSHNYAVSVVGFDYIHDTDCLAQMDNMFADDLGVWVRVDVRVDVLVDAVMCCWLIGDFYSCYAHIYLRVVVD